MDMKDILGFAQKAVPWLAAAATSNVPALIGLAASALGNATGKVVDATQPAILQAVSGASPADLLKFQQAEDEVKTKAMALGFQHEEEMAKIGLQETQTYVSDAQDARHAFSSDRRVFWLGVAVLIVFLLDVIGTIWLAYQILSDGIEIADVGVVAAVFGLLGTLNGYVAAQAQQVCGFFFGSSRGSDTKNAALSSAITSLAPPK